MDGATLSISEFDDIDLAELLCEEDVASDLGRFQFVDDEMYQEVTRAPISDGLRRKIRLVSCNGIRCCMWFYINAFLLQNGHDIS